MCVRVENFKGKTEKVANKIVEVPSNATRTR